MEKRLIVPKGILLPFALLTSLFFAWALPNNLTDTMLAAFKRIMSMSDSKTAWIPTIYGMGIAGLGEDTKMGGAGMVMAIAGAAVLTQIQGIVSDQAGSIELAYWVPAIAFMVVAYYSAFVSHKHKPAVSTEKA